jgi:hypothetical protein
MIRNYDIPQGPVMQLSLLFIVIIITHARLTLFIISYFLRYSSAELSYLYY